MDVTGAVLTALCTAYMAMPGAIFMRQDNDYTRPTFKITKRVKQEDGTVVAETDEYTDADIEDMPESEEKAFAIMYRQAAQGSRQWLLDLSACWQVRPLNGGNVTGYFASQGGTIVKGASLVHFFEAVKNSLRRVMADERYRSLLTKNKFMRYHTSAASTAGLVKRAVSECKGMIRLSPASAAAINDAVAAYWDLDMTDRIPKHLVAFTHAYLSSANQLPDNWYQGKAAVAEVSTKLYRKWRAFLDKASELSLNIDAMRDAKTLAELATYVSVDDLTF